tara:strand:+ start:8838 stop:9908 length:1071 start_codon:yes stop_codon:yes gene_type:complete
MIKFFRKIRQRLLTDNKFSKYFLYAIGEIVLVVIGILIALQINTWNEEQKNRFEEKNLLLELRTEFREKKESLDANKRQGAGFIKNISIYDTYANASAPEYNLDSLRFLVRSLTMGNFFITPNSTLNSIENSAKIYLIKNDELRNYFKIWKNSVIKLNDFQEKREAWINDNYPILSEYFLFKDLYPDGTRALEIIDATNDHKGIQHFFIAPSNQNMVQSFLDISYALYYTSEGVLAVTNEVLQMIDEELMKYEDIKVEPYFSEIRVTGDAVDNAMSFVILKKLSNGTWEGILPLKDGTVTFSNRAAGVISWTGDEFPKGKLQGAGYWDNNISVKKGVYRVIFDFETGSYEFIKIND